MSTLHIIIQALCFTVNSFAVFFIVIAVTRVLMRIEGKLDYHISLIRYVKGRQSMMYISSLKDVMNRLIKDERYEEAAKIKEIIEFEVEELNDESLKTE